MAKISMNCLSSTLSTSRTSKAVPARHKFWQSNESGAASKALPEITHVTKLVLFQEGFGFFDEFAFFGVELVEEAAGAEVERAAGLFVGSGALGAVVKAPTGCAALDRAAEVGEEIGGGGLPIGVAAAEGFLVVERGELVEFAHKFQAGAGFGFGFGG